MDGMALLIAVVTFIMALVALNRTAKLQTANFLLKAEIDKLKSGTPDQRVVPEVASIAPAAPAPLPGNWGPAAATAPEPAPAAPVEPAAEVSAPPPRPDMEQALAGRWFVWIGGLAIAIGGLLFVKYAYDNDLISPPLQIILALAAGFILVAAGLWLGRRAEAEEGQPPDYVPAALAAAGLAVLFGAIYAAYALYTLIDPRAAFLGLAAVGIGGLVLSRRLGTFIAALGLIGSYGTPALIPATDPSAWSFFPYLLIILLFSFLTLRGRRWWWLGYAAIAGTLLWSMLWISGPFQTADLWPIGLSAILLGLITMFALQGPRILSNAAEDEPAQTPALALAAAGQGAGVAVLVLLALRTDHSTLGLSLLAAGLLLAVLFAWIRHGLALLAPVAGLVMLGVLGIWREAAFHALTLDEYGLQSWSSSFGPESQRFLQWMLGAGSAFTAAGIAGVLLRPRKRVWGALGGGAAFLYVFGAWARADFLLTPMSWAWLAGGTAVVLLLASALWSRRQEGDDLGAGLLIAAAAALLVMSADQLHDGIWLTLEIAALAFVLALLSGLLKPRLLGPVAAAVATLATLRLFLSRELWLDDKGLPWGDHWVLYGYGVPAILFLLGAKALQRTGHTRSAMALEGMSLGLAISLISLELRVLIAGGISYDNPQFLEMAAHILTWAGAAYGLMHRQRLFSSVIATWGARLLLLVSALAVVGLSLTALNPVFTGEPVPGGLVFNALLLAYLAPVPLIILIARRLDVIGWQEARPAAYVLALVLLFAYITIETKRIFQGMLLTAWPQSLAENYAYSAVWLVFALALFVAGIRLGRQPVRLAGLAVLALVVLKVFIGDMSNLEGLLRIASFVGLGLCLVGIGWLYQHFVRRGNAATAKE